MAVVTKEKIDQLLRARLRERGVSGKLDRIDLFPTPEGVLAEVVLRDASALEQAQQAVDSVENQLEGERISLLPTVRALWEVEKVRGIEIPNPPGAPSDLVGALFKGILKSGARRQEVWVAVTPSAQQVLRPLATRDQDWVGLVGKFLLHRLSVGGAGHWDPIREQKLELDGSAAQYLRWRPYEQLKRSVDLVFRSIDRARDFLQSFNLGGKKASDFNHVLEELPGPGGAIARGERVPTSNYHLYQMLLVSEKEDLRQYYFEKLERACNDWPELKAKFPKVLAA